VFIAPAACQNLTTAYVFPAAATKSKTLAVLKRAVGFIPIVLLFEILPMRSKHLVASELRKTTADVSTSPSLRSGCGQHDERFFANVDESAATEKQFTILEITLV
jgi:hypothetical protein